MQFSHSMLIDIEPIYWEKWYKGEKKTNTQKQGIMQK